MLNASEFYELASGRKTGVWATILRGVLRIAEIPYGIVVRSRNKRFDSGSRQIDRVACPVVSVGNLTVGGTGKTPMVHWLAEWFLSQDVKLAIVSRGYGAKQGERNDEAKELASKLPSVPHIQNPIRIIAARQAVDQHGAELILLDDGYQHRQLHRDLDIVLVDAMEPFGFEHMLPRGALREPLTGFARADVIVLTRCDSVTEDGKQAIWDRISEYAPKAVQVEVGHKPTHLESVSGRQLPIEQLAGQRVFAFCAIGNPQSFRHTLDMANAKLVELREFPDHHIYSPEDVTSLTEWANAQNDIAAVVCTQKDLVKLEQDAFEDIPLFAVNIGLDIQQGQAMLEEVLGSVESIGSNE